ncbi:MAG TPA: ABC transporter permease [Chloroflexota bacterium]|nr:ABC transporter permease [Chloroflexota bacterium]
MRRVWILLEKDLYEMLRQRALLGGVLGPAVILTAIPLVVFAASAWLIGHPGGTPPPTAPRLEGLSAGESAQVFVGTEFSALYVLMPVILTSVIAAYGVVGEKTARTLEPLLATPLRTSELLLAKILGSLLPGLAMTWISGIIFVVGLRVFTANARVFAMVITPGWLILLILWAPLLAVVATAGIVMISSRVNDPRSAQQLSATLVVPFLILIVGQAAGRVVLSPSLTLAVAAVLAVLAVLMLRVATSFFQREAILTRWR